MITFESIKADNKFHIVRYGIKIGYIEKNRNTKEWYVGSIRSTLGADELQIIVDKMNKLNAASATDAMPTADDGSDAGWPQSVRLAASATDEHVGGGSDAATCMPEPAALAASATDEVPQPTPQEERDAERDEE